MDERGDEDVRGHPPWQMVLGCGAALVWLASPVLLYLGVLSLLGLLPHPELSWVQYTIGGVLSLFTMGVVSIMGESLIEDVVKFLLFGGAAVGMLASKGTVVGAIAMGVAVGAFMPLGVRLVTSVSKRFGSPGG